MTELLARNERGVAKKLQWEEWCTTAQIRVGELRETNVTLSELPRDTEKKAKAVEENLKIQTTTLQSRSGSIGIEVLKAVEAEINKNVELRTDVHGSEAELKAIKEEMVKLKEIQVHNPLSQPLSPITEDIPEFTQQTQHTTQSNGSLGLEAKITRQTYTLQEGFQW